MEDLVGTKPAVILLQQSLKPGRYKDYMKWDRMRSYSTVYGNIWSAGVLVLGFSTLSGADINMVVTTTPTRGTLFKIFMGGNNKWTGIIKIKTLVYQEKLCTQCWNTWEHISGEKFRGREKLDRSSGGIFGYGILWHTKRRRGTAKKLVNTRHPI